MYATIWRVLPGPTAVKAILAVLLVLGVVAALFLWVFPTVAPYMPFNDQTVGTG